MATPIPAGAMLYTHLNSNASTDNLLTRAGMLHTITINTKGATGNTLTVYDNAAHGSNTLAVIDTTGATQCFIFDAWLQNGLSVTIASGTAADVTLTYF
jgi:hypothetical protein